jgi:hypothetical protein
MAASLAASVAASAASTKANRMRAAPLGEAQAAVPFKACVRSEVAAIEKQLRHLTAEREEVEEVAALQARLHAQLALLPAAERPSAQATLQKVHERLRVHAATQTERRREAQRLVARIGELRRHAEGIDE